MRMGRGMERKTRRKKSRKVPDITMIGLSLGAVTEMRNINHLIHTPGTRGWSRLPGPNAGHKKEKNTRK